MRFEFDARQCRDLEFARSREWILTNGLGGFAMGTVAGINTRRYHGLLIAATRPPAERTLLLAGLEASVQTDGEPVWISSNQYAGVVYPEGYLYAESFVLDAAATWAFRLPDASVTKRVSMNHGANRVRVEFENTGPKPFLLTLRPFTACRSYHANFHESPDYPASIEFPKDRTVVVHKGVTLVLSHKGAQRTPVEGWYYRFEHRQEVERGLDPRDDLFCPCELRYEVMPGCQAVLEAWEGLAEPICEEGCSGGAAPKPSVEEQLRAAAEKFLVEGNDRPSIVAGYPWFTDWGRDTMIALPGICLSTGRVALAREILRAFARTMMNGLIPNRFLESGAVEYNTCDATLWYANAAYETLLAEWDQGFAEELLQVLREVWTWHRAGTMNGIAMDPIDGLLTQGADGQQLTWMDAKVGSWVVTPRHGKPVEVNGLWVNMLRIAAWLCERLSQDPGEFVAAADLAEASFNDRFWIESRGHYFDTVDPQDASMRPNQVIAMALPFGPAKGDRALAALRVVELELLTPVGLRTLGPGEPGYRPRFEGPIAELDAAYHQGTVWPWLLGPYVSAVLRLTGDRRRARMALSQVREMLGEKGLGGIAEVYDGDPPHRPNGCPWQAWSVAEVLRAWHIVEGRSS